MDQSNEKEPGSIDPSSRDCSSPDLAANGSLKSCTDCQTTKTPLWRGGPFGPKSLCNACGIRYRKKRREVLGVKERRIGGGEVGKESRKDGVSEKLRKALAVGSDSWKRRSAAVLQKQRRRLGEEEEQAAVLLMSLSSGFLYAH